MTLWQILAEGPGLVTISQRATNSPYPPSFDNNPAIFGWALFARLLILLMSSATMLRIRSRNQSEGLPANHPVFYHRMTVMCFLGGAWFSSASDVMTYLLWNETTEYATTVVMLLARVFDALSMFPFLGALFVPLWLGWLRAIGVVQTAPSVLLNGMIHDLKVTWDTPSIPIRLLAYSGATAALVTIGKYWLWVEHGHP